MKDKVSNGSSGGPRGGRLNCYGFLASTLCNGVNIVRAFNEGRFECDDIVREMIIRGEINESR